MTQSHPDPRHCCGMSGISAGFITAHTSCDGNTRKHAGSFPSYIPGRYCFQETETRRKSISIDCPHMTLMTLMLLSFNTTTNGQQSCILPTTSPKTNGASSIEDGGDLARKGRTSMARRLKCRKTVSSKSKVARYGERSPLSGIRRAGLLCETNTIPLHTNLSVASMS